MSGSGRGAAGAVRAACGAATVTACLVAAVPVWACSIPVFRYALERWPTDQFRIEVTLPERPSADDRAGLVRLEDGAAVNGGMGNYVVTRVAGGPAGPAHVGIRGPRDDAPLWQGSVAAAVTAVAAGPVHRELVRRLLAGDAVVWLVVRGTDAAAADRACALLEAELPLVAADTPLPRGVGLPGSELRADVPLEVRFSVLVVEPEDAAAGLLRRTLAARATGLDAPGAAAVTLVAPVFGRGRVARVIRADECDADTIADVTAFLCGACSCQVKQLSPGFDLLLEAAWDERLFGGDAPAAPPRAAATAPPVYVPIPGGAGSPARSVTTP